MFNTDRIKKIRIDNNMSQSDVAKLMKVGRSSYAMWESNNNIFPIRRLLDFCDIFRINIDYILGLGDNAYNIDSKYNKDKSHERLKEFRKDNNLTQEKIADFLHIDQPTWSIYEAGKSIIGTPFLYMICKKYQVSADYILGRSEIKELKK